MALEPVAPVARQSQPRWPWWIAVFAFLVYQGNLRVIPAQDAIPSRLLPLSLLQEGNFTLTEFFAPGEAIHPWAFRRVGTEIYSIYSPVTGLLAVPVFALGLPIVGGGPDSILILEKIAAGLVAAGAVAATGIALSRMVAPSAAMAATLLLALGTPLWTIASQTLWQHGPAALFSALGLLALAAPPTPRRMTLAGLAAGFAVWTRPTGLVTAAGLGLAAWLADRARFRWFLAGLLPGLACLLGYNLAVFHHPLGGHPDARGESHFWVLSRIPWNLAGLLVSPNRGLWVYSPVLALSVLAAVRARTPILRGAAAAAGGYLLLFAAYARWDGGWAFGPRYLTDGLPFWTVLLATALERGRNVRILALVLGAWSIAVQALGAFRYDVQWDMWRTLDAHPERVWDWPRTQIAACLGRYPWDRDGRADLQDALPFPSSGSGLARLGTGWHLPEGPVVWSRPGRATLFLPRPTDGRWLGLTLTTRTARWRQPRVVIEVNGVRVADVTVTHRPRPEHVEAILLLPPLPPDNPAEIALTCDSWFRDTARDNLRRYAIGLSAVAFGPNEAQTRRHLHAGASAASP